MKKNDGIRHQCVVRSRSLEIVPRGSYFFKMEALITRYYDVNRFLLLLSGLWPFQNKIQRHLISFFIYIIFVSSILVQIFKLIVSEPSFEIYINVTAYATLCIIFFSKYSMYAWQLENLKRLFLRLSHNWKTLLDENEYRIMEEYAIKGKKFTYFCLMLTSTFVILLVIWTSILLICDIIAPLNGTHHVEPPFLAEYFIDEEIYFYHILSHMYMLFLVSTVVILSTETSYLICVEHACGLFYLTGYRLEQAFNETTLNLLPFSKRDTEMSRKIVRAIETHKNALEFVDHMISCFAPSYIVIFVFAIVSLTVNYTAILQAIKAEKTYDIVNDFARICNITCYFFCVSYCGQKLINSSTSIFDKTYNLPWYLATPTIQRSLLFVLQRSLKRCTLVIFTMYPLSLELFGTILKLTSCYVTTLRALQ